MPTPALLPPPRPARIAARLGVFLLLAVAAAGCSMTEGGPGTLELSLTPTSGDIGQTEALSFTARVTPVPDEPLTFQWETLARFGKLRDDAPFGSVEEVTSAGRSTVLYSATPVGNPGGTETLNVRVFDADGNELAEASAEVVVAPPAPQRVLATQVEFTRPGSTPGRVDVYILTAWEFDVIPGFSRYIFTVVTPAGQGWDVGPVGSRWPHSLSGALVDRAEFVAAYGSDMFELGEDRWALLAGGVVFGNFNPNDPGDAADLEVLRASRARLAQAVYDVEPDH